MKFDISILLSPIILEKPKDFLGLLKYLCWGNITRLLTNNITNINILNHLVLCYPIGLSDRDELPLHLFLSFYLTFDLASLCYPCFPPKKNLPKYKNKNINLN